MQASFPRGVFLQWEAEAFLRNLPNMQSNELYD